MLLFYGGSFDPPHIGHLILPRDVMEFFGYRKVVFIPAYISPFKAKLGHRASAEDRLKMLELALKGIPYYEIEPYEVLKRGISYTYETVQYLRRKHNLEKVHWLMGDDTFLNFHKWHRWRELLHYLEPVVMLRRSVFSEVESYAKTVLGLNSVRTYKGRRLEISSTEIRKRIKQGLDIRFLVPYGVYLYIKERKLYK